MAGWTAILLGATAYLVGPLFLGPILLLTLPEFLGGNITLLIAAAIVLSFRWPASWSFVILTKVTPGVGLLWFAARREWRNLGIALAATLAIVGVSYVYAPEGTWATWVQVLTFNASSPIDSGSLPVPLIVRLPIAAAVIVWGALRDRRWALPIGCLLALPVIWYGSLSLLVAVIPLVRRPELRDWHWHGMIEAARGWWLAHRPASSATDRQVQEA